MHMQKLLFYPASATPASLFASEKLRHHLPITDTPSPDVTHLLLDTPAFLPDGTLRCAIPLSPLLQKLSPGITICGGALNDPALAAYSKIDLLSDPAYLASNAYITAECVLDVALPRLSCLVRGCPVLILGWGRIGKCLALLLKNMGADVTIAARNTASRAIITALGFENGDIASLIPALPRFRLLVNTVPAPQLTARQLSQCHSRCIKIDLASRPGLAGEDILVARGLPGIYRPEASGQLIADTLLRLLNKEETV